MEDINNLIVQREIAKNIILEVENFLPKVNKSYLQLEEEYFALEKQLKSMGQIENVFNHAKNIEKLNEKIILNLAVKNRLLNLIEKNKERLKYINNEIKLQLITEKEFSQKQLAKFIQDSNVEVTDKNINLNASDNGTLKIFFNDSLLLIENGQLDLTKKENYETLLHYEEKYLFMIFDRYHTCLANIPIEMLLHTKTRLKILKYIANKTSELLKEKSIFEINGYFGELLNIKVGQEVDFKTYVSEIDNLFNIRIRNYLIENHGKYEDLIKEKIDCKSNSIFLPAEYNSQDDMDILMALFDNLVK